LFGATTGGWWVWVSNEFVDLIKKIGDFETYEDARQAAKSIAGEANYGN